MKKTCCEFSLVAFLVVCAFVPRAWADTVVVACKSEFQLALVDPATEKVLVKLPTGRGPHEVAVSPDGRFAYVSNFGRYSVYPAGDTEHDKASNTITVIDLVDRKVKATFDLGTHTGPHGMTVSHDGKLVWVTTETPQAILELDSATGKIQHVWNTTQERSHMIVATPKETKFYVTNTVSGTVSMIDRSTGEVKVISTGPGTRALPFRRMERKSGPPAAPTRKFRSSRRLPMRSWRRFRAAGKVPSAWNLLPTGRRFG